jgi:hypothetical protein
VAADLADQAYGHCLAVLGDPAVAAEAAAAALRKAGRSRSSVLAHARFQALDRAGAMAAPAPDTSAPADLGELAQLLAATRAPTERAVLDLRARLDRADLGQALGVPAAAAAERADAVGEAWDAELDPLLMARLGPADCLLLAAVLADADLSHPTLGDLLAVGPAVASHVEGCSACTDRHRAMVSVRALVAQGDSPDAPESVRDAARRSRRMRPGAAPPSLEPSRRRPLLIAVGVVGALVLVGGAAATAAALTGPRSGRAKRVAALVHVPTGAPLALTLRRDSVEITNRSGRPVQWRATAEAPWLRVEPASGRLAAGEMVWLTTRVLPSSPEGALRTTVTVTGDDGSAAATVYETAVERPPDLASGAEGCAVSATVEDASGVGEVLLHWTDAGGAHQGVMQRGDNGYAATLPKSVAVSWWVTAVDARGNQARTSETRSTC